MIRLNIDDASWAFYFSAVLGYFDCQGVFAEASIKEQDMLRGGDQNRAKSWVNIGIRGHFYIFSQAPFFPFYTMTNSQSSVVPYSHNRTVIGSIRTWSSKNASGPSDRLRLTPTVAQEDSALSIKRHYMRVMLGTDPFNGRRLELWCLSWRHSTVTHCVLYNL